MRHDGYNHLYTPGESTTKAQRAEMRRKNKPTVYKMSREDWERRFPNEPYPKRKKGA